MTPQEQQMLQGLVQRIQGTALAGKDTEAEKYIQQALGSNRDALYILCQTVLVQQYALDQARKQLADARQQQQSTATQPEHHTSFLGKLFGSGDNPQPQRPAQPQYAPVPYGGAPQGQGYGSTPQVVYGQPQYAQPATSGGMFGGGGGGFGGGGFLQGAMQTAAGVAAGELAFRGIEDLMHGFGHPAGYGSDRAMGGFDDRSNFSGDDRAAEGGDSFGDRLQAADGSSGDLSSDIEDRRDAGGRGFFGGDDGTDGSAFTDDGSMDNSGGDDGSFDGGNSFGGDDSGGSDDNS